VIAVPPVDAVNQPLKTYPVRVGVPGELIDAPVVVVVLSIALPSCSSVVTVNVCAVHTTYSVTLSVMVNVLAAARDVPPHATPATGCVVHQPTKVYPVLASDPVLPATVTVALLAYAVASVGAVPDVGELPL